MARTKSKPPREYSGRCRPEGSRRGSAVVLARVPARVVERTGASSALLRPQSPLYIVT